jgi:hypothetical protein
MIFFFLFEKKENVSPAFVRKNKRTQTFDPYNVLPRPNISVIFASREIILTKYILKNINIYGI